MPIEWLDHVNLRTARLDEMAAFYRDVVGLEAGDRPDFGFRGAWLYCDGKAAVHLVGVGADPRADDPRIEHFAFRATGLNDYMANLRAHDVPYFVRTVPGVEVRQLNYYDPDGNHIEVQFLADDDPNADLAAHGMPEPKRIY